jgi:hypothetical protein
MDVYIYKAALFCEDCAGRIKSQLARDGYEVKAAEDSDDYPCGPYSNGGGEADSPQHCDECSEFLENPLTEDGRRYVLDMIETRPQQAANSGSALHQWREFYAL